MFNNLRDMLGRKADHAKSEQADSPVSPSDNEPEPSTEGSDQERYHKKLKGFICPACLHHYPNPEELQNHYESAHIDDISSGAAVGRNTFNCPVCKMKLGSAIELQAHVARHHGDSKERGEVEALKMQINALIEGKDILHKELNFRIQEHEKQVEENCKLSKEKESAIVKADEQADRITSLIDEKREILSKNKFLELQVENAEKQIFLLESEIKQRPEADDMKLLKQELIAVKNENNECKKKMNDLVLLHTKEKEEIQSLCSELQKRCSDLQDSNNSITSKYQGKVSILQEQVARFLDDIARSNMEKKDLEKKLEQLHELQAENAKQKAILSDNNRLEHELQNANKKVGDLEVIVQKREQNIVKLKDELQIAKEEVADVKISRDELISKIEKGEGMPAALTEALQAQISELTKKVHEQENSYDVMVKTMKIDMDNLHDQLKHAQEEYQRISALNEILSRDLTNVQMKLSETESEKSVLLSELETQKKYIDELTQVTEETNEKLTVKTQELSKYSDNLKTVLSALEDQIEELSNSLISTAKEFQSSGGELSPELTHFLSFQGKDKLRQLPDIFLELFLNIKLLNSDLKEMKEKLSEAVSIKESTYAELVIEKSRAKEMDQMYQEKITLIKSNADKNLVSKSDELNEVRSELEKTQAELCQNIVNSKKLQDNLNEMEQKFSSVVTEKEMVQSVLQEQSYFVEIASNKSGKKIGNKNNVDGIFGGGGNGVSKNIERQISDMMQKFHEMDEKLSVKIDQFNKANDKLEKIEMVMLNLGEAKATLECKVQELNNMLSSKHEELESTKKIITSEQLKFKSLSTQLEKEKSVKEDLDIQLQNTQQCLKEAHVKLNEMANKIESDEVVKRELQRDKDALHVEVTDLNEKITELCSAHDSLNKVKTDLVNKLARSEEGIIQLKTEIDVCNAEKDYAVKELSELTSKYNETETRYREQGKKLTEIRRLYDEEKQLHIMDSEELESAKKIMVNQTLQFNEELDQVKNSHQKALEAKHEVVNKYLVENEALARGCAEISTQLDELQVLQTQKQLSFEETISHLEAQIGILTESRNALQEELKSEQTQHNETKDKFTELSGCKLELEAKLENALEERKALLERCLKSESDNESLVKRNTDLRRKLDESVAALHDLGRENQTLQVENMKHMGRKWADDAEVVHCTACGKLFTVTVRKHHCRNCGDIFCNECSNKTATVAASKKPVRVCHLCYNELTK